MSQTHSLTHNVSSLLWIDLDVVYGLEFDKKAISDGYRGKNVIGLGFEFKVFLESYSLCGPCYYRKGRF